MISTEVISSFCRTNNTCKLKSAIKALSAPLATVTCLAPLQSDVFVPRQKDIREELLDIRGKYLSTNSEAFLTLDHIKSNYDNNYLTSSISNQTKNLDAVSTDDFCGLSEILENIKTPKDMIVYRAMEAGDFNIGRLTPEQFFEEYYKEGKTVTVPIYMSTSLDKNIAYRFAKDNPFRFLIKLNVPKDTPAVYMENLTPGDPYDNEDELLVTKNALVKLGKVTKTINPLNNKAVYEIEGTIVGHKFIKPEIKPAYNPDNDPEMQEFLSAFKNI